VISVHRAAARYVTTQPGITTRHCFSSGSHYDPANVAFGALLAVDEHLVAPGCGFAAHRHRGVELLSWVLRGRLRHSDATGRESFVEPGVAQYQHAGSGIEHVEGNASVSEPLRFVQIWLTAAVDEPRYRLAEPPVPMAAGEFAVHRSGTASFAGRVHLYVARGAFSVGTVQLAEGDSVRADEAITVDGDGELLVFTLTA
jgi:quercetin 2,3-dioxygenase